MQGELFTAPTPVLEPRAYQKEAVEKTLEALHAGERPLVIMATGTGKTVVSSLIISSMIGAKKRSLYCAHRDELINQAKRSIQTWADYTSSVEMANEYADRHRLSIIASVPTLRGRRLEQFPERHFDLGIVDEAHHATAASYRNIIKRFDSAMWMGQTATPDRADQNGLGSIFSTVSYEYPLHKAIKDGHLVPIIGRRIRDFDIDLSQVKINAGDFSPRELEEKVCEYITPIAKAIKKETEGMSTLIFMPDVRSSALMAEVLNSMGMKADFVSGGTEKAERRQTLYRFHSGELTHLASCNVFLEGFDEPRIQAIVMCRPTSSRVLYTQAVGRGTRLFDGKKHLLLVEFTYNSEKLRLVSAYELFSTLGYGEKIQAKAIRTGEKQDYEDFLQNIETEKTRHDQIPELVKGALHRSKDYAFDSFDPIGLGDLVGVDISGEFDIYYQGRKLQGHVTEKQMELLCRYGVSQEEVGKLTRASASVLLDKLMERTRPMIGLATEAQLNFLERLGAPINRNSPMPKAMASLLIDAYKRNGAGR